MRASKVLVLVLFFFLFSFANANIPVPVLTGHVVDQTSTLSLEQKGNLEKVLQNVEDEMGSQLAVLIIPSTSPETIEQYALRVAEAWKLGRKKVDDGVILVVAKDDHAIRLEVGYGLEGSLNDAVCKRIISEVITPHFKEDDFYGGIVFGENQIIRVISGESFFADKVQLNGKTPNIRDFIPIIFLLSFVIGGGLRYLVGRLPSAVLTGIAVAVMTVLFFNTILMALASGLIGFFFTIFGGGMGGYGIGRYYGGGFGGRLIGGGGGFGGGGASGRW